MPVNPPRSINDLTAAIEEHVAQLENAQIGPSVRALANDRMQHLLGRPIRTRLRQDQRRRCGRARYTRMAMDEQMRAPRLGQVTSEREELLDIETFRRDPAGARFDHVMKTQLELPMRIEGTEGLGFGSTGIQDRQDMSDACLPMEAEFIDSANCHLERRQAL